MQITFTWYSISSLDRKAAFSTDISFSAKAHDITNDLADSTANSNPVVAIRKQSSHCKT